MCSSLERKLADFSSVPSSWRHCIFLPNQTLNREVAGQKKEKKKRRGEGERKDAKAKGQILCGYKAASSHLSQ